ncbi:MAG: DUF5668 domain-containing protein, partial [Chloroflexota bacterium]|nr:DUF5668 domain-containing protein [Chloroflexota bacterium]
MPDFQEPKKETSFKIYHSRSIFWPLLLIGGGVVLLMSNLGYIPQFSWNVLWRLWPLALVALGIEIIFGRRSRVGAILSGFLILVLITGAVALAFFAPDIPYFNKFTQQNEWRTEHIEHPLGEIESATVTIDWTSVSGYLSALNDSPNLIAGDIIFQGDLIFDANVRGGQADVTVDSRFSGTWFSSSFVNAPDAKWDIGLTPNVPLALNLDAGSGSCDFALSDLQLSNLFLDSGSGSIELSLPSESTFQAIIDSGSGSVTIHIPDSVGVRVEIDSGSGSFNPSERFTLVAGERND